MEEIIDIDRSLELFSDEQLNMLNPRDYMAKGYYLSPPLFLDIIGHKYSMEEKKDLV